MAFLGLQQCNMGWRKDFIPLKRFLVNVASMTLFNDVFAVHIRITSRNWKRGLKGRNNCCCGFAKQISAASSWKWLFGEKGCMDFGHGRSLSSLSYPATKPKKSRHNHTAHLLHTNSSQNCRWAVAVYTSKMVTSSFVKWLLSKHASWDTQGKDNLQCFRSSKYIFLKK